MLPAQMRGVIPGAPLPLDQSLLLIWPQITGLIAGMIVVFAAAYVVFQREEVAGLKELDPRRGAQQCALVRRGLPRPRQGRPLPASTSGSMPSRCRASIPTS